MMKLRGRTGIGFTTVIAVALGLSACAPPGTGGAATDSGGDTSDVTIGIVASLTGPLSGNAQQFVDGVAAGIDYATAGTNQVDGRNINVVQEDDAYDVTKVAGGITSLVGKGAKVVLAANGTEQVSAASDLAVQNDFVLISGIAAGDTFTARNRNTFRAAIQSSQVSSAMAVAAGDVNGKTVGVFALNSAFGQAVLAGAKAAFEPKGANVQGVLVPPNATDLTPYAEKLSATGATTFLVNWVGGTTSQMWSALDQQGVLDAGKVFTTLDYGPTHPLLAPAAGKAKVFSGFFKGATENEQATALSEYLGKNGVQSKTIDVYSSNGWNAGVMAVHALKSSTTDASAMIEALEDFTFDAPAGTVQIRGEDHAFIQDMFVGDLIMVDGVPAAQLVKTLPSTDVSPPARRMAG